ncbi:uncharacterized protein N0V89_005092 [Didymosphaeria variabile]|uniref:Uncharacterized protein n=1 Tax=Didymosphaeria variabile TaxID=1932322 RepID=A0A9W9CBF8_9PLEO|nr:uncharacterized protein N0V89_005092 [Didymosphaeria variabile]KAJ4353363.1 hypothetical protein N0V89_005092 [Didymosphaeria variabile]
MISACACFEQVIPVRLGHPIDQADTTTRRQWGFFVKIASEIWTIVLVSIYCIGCKGLPNVDTRKRWLQRRGVLSDPRFKKIMEKFADQPVAAVQDVQLLTVNKPTSSDTNFSPRRYLHDLGIAKHARDINFMKPYTDGNGTDEYWTRSVGFAHIGDSLLEFSHGVRAYDDKAVPTEPFQRVEMSAFEFTDVPMHHLYKEEESGDEGETDSGEQSAELNSDDRPEKLRRTTVRSLKKLSNLSWRGGPMK